MNLTAPDEAADGSGQPEPPDPDVIEIDPTGRYVRYKELLGKGAFKTVHKAFDEVDGIEVAWNQASLDDLMQSPENLRHLCLEVNLLEGLNHNNIMKFYAWWVDERKKTMNIITELFTSGSLRQYQRKHKRVNMKAVKRWARQILMGLDYLHSHKPPIIHRDLKCDNIFINGNHGEVKIGDLGFAIALQQPNAKSVVGTPEFMAPELYDEEYNELVDIYSFGMCMLEMVTFEYPYRECTNSAQIYKKVSSGIKPAALSKVKDPEVKAFIEKCLVPAAERLPARELLKDPFLQVDGMIVAQGSHLSHVLDISMPMMVSLGDHAFVLEEPKTSGNAIQYSQDMDVDENEPLFVTEIESSSNNGSHLLTLEIQRKKGERDFRLRGEKNGSDTLKLKLQISDQKDPRTIEFFFYLGSYTALSVADEVVGQLKLPKRDTKFIAELIDFLLTKLVTGWKPSLAINHLVTMSETQTLQDGPKDMQLVSCGKSSDGSFQNVSETTNVCGYSSSTGGFIEMIHDTADAAVNLKLDNTETYADMESCSMVTSDGQGSEASFVSAALTELNHVKTPGALARSSLRHMVCHEYMMDAKVGKTLSKTENCLHFDQKGKDARSMPGDSHLTSQGALTLGNENEADQELQMELQSIDLQYQQAINDICQKWQQAVSAAKERAAQKKLLLH